MRKGVKDIVDYFIIVESTHTFSGKEKPLFYENIIFLKDLKEQNKSNLWF
jgi:hypothetical protein